MKFLIDPLRRIIKGISNPWRHWGKPPQDLEDAIARNIEAQDILKESLLHLMTARTENVRPRSAKPRPKQEDSNDIH